MKKAILCVGNELRGDDAVGIELGRIIEENHKEWHVFYGHDTPEDEIYAIKNLAPDMLVVIDAAVTDEPDLKAEFMQNEAGTAFNTHTLPLHVLTRFLSDYCDKILLLALFVKVENFTGIRQGLSEHGKMIVECGYEKFKELNNLLNS